MEIAEILKQHKECVEKPREGAVNILVEEKSGEDLSDIVDSSSKYRDVPFGDVKDMIIPGIYNYEGNVHYKLYHAGGGVYMAKKNFDKYQKEIKKQCHEFAGQSIKI
jgi:hypothetical protein